MKCRLLVAAMVLASMASTFGCATAEEEIDGVVPRERVDGGDDDDDTSAPYDSGSSVYDSGTSADTSPKPPADTGSPTTDTSADTGSPTDTGPGTPCTALTSTDCASSAQLMAGISGDKASSSTTSGTDSKFLRIRVAETDSSIFSAKALRSLITLTSTGANFDLYVYMGKAAGDGGGYECSTVRSSATEALGSPDVVSLMWADDQGFGGHDDSRYLSIEVRAADASCTGASWTLTVEGNK